MNSVFATLSIRSSLGSGFCWQERGIDREKLLLLLLLRWTAHHAQCNNKKVLLLVLFQEEAKETEAEGKRKKTKVTRLGSISITLKAFNGIS